MVRISLIPDTNIFISHLDILNKFCDDSIEGLPVEFGICIPAIVIRELDFQKKDSHKARDAIRFIENLLPDMKVLRLEGFSNKADMDVVSGNLIVKDVENNDDKIIKYASQRVNPIILTLDKGLYIKAKTYDLKALLVSGLTYEEIKNKIIKDYTKMEPMDIIDDHTDLSSDSAIINHTKKKLLPVVLTIMQQAIGETYVLFFPDPYESITLEYIVKLIIKEFFLFSPYLPKSSLKLVKELNEEINNNKGNDLKKSCSKLLMLFRIQY